MPNAHGPFEVRMTPQLLHEQAIHTGLGRLALDKTFHGDLEATSQGEMLAARTSVEHSAGYVALEQVSGTLHGRSGSFVLQHSGTMNRGAPQLVITVVPDSGTGELVGLSGAMTIENVDGQHSYTLAYELGD